jgi:hypothetical protein
MRSRPPARTRTSATVGVYITGGTKGILRRLLATFNLYGSAAEGRPLKPTDNVLLAELLADAEGINGPTFQIDTQRLTRADYVAAQATWNNYKTATAWTAAGGDVAPSPAVASFTSPAHTGDQVIQNNLAPFVTDALVSRNGLVLLRWNANNENPGVTTFCTLVAAAGYTPALRLRVTYADVAPAPIDRPAAATVPGATPASPDRPARPAAPSPPATANSRQQTAKGTAKG